jgi:hypothetical protein
MSHNNVASAINRFWTTVMSVILHRRRSNEVAKDIKPDPEELVWRSHVIAQLSCQYKD